MQWNKTQSVKRSILLFFFEILISFPICLWMKSHQPPPFDFLFYTKLRWWATISSMSFFLFIFVGLSVEIGCFEFGISFIKWMKRLFLASVNLIGKHSGILDFLNCHLIVMIGHIGFFYFSFVFRRQWSLEIETRWDRKISCGMFNGVKLFSRSFAFYQTRMKPKIIILFELFGKDALKNFKIFTRNRDLPNHFLIVFRTYLFIESTTNDLHMTMKLADKTHH